MIVAEKKKSKVKTAFSIIAGCIYGLLSAYIGLYSGLWFAGCLVVVFGEWFAIPASLMIFASMFFVGLLPFYLEATRNVPPNFFYKRFFGAYIVLAIMVQVLKRVWF